MPESGFELHGKASFARDTKQEPVAVTAFRIWQNPKAKKHRRLVVILTLFGGEGIQVGESLSLPEINKGPGDLRSGKLR